MKVAFTAYGNGWKEQVDIRFGRAKGFFVVDTENDQTSYIDNSANVEAAHGAGTSASQAIVDAGVEILVTGKVGPKAGDVLKVGGVKVLGGIGYATIEEAYEKYKKGVLEEQQL
jgi:predicted Fe-Mo cluster-binding NifX family protein